MPDPALPRPEDASPAYYLGMPFWGFREWVGNFYRRGSRPASFLEQYASVFDTVEGNTTFYSLPSESTVATWYEAVPPRFRFCFKFPRFVTHEGRLDARSEPTRLFLDRMAPLGDRLGPFLAQLPPSFGPDRLGELDAFLARLPEQHHYAVELRHRAFYDDESLGRRADEMLWARGCERCSMDTRPMRDGDLDHPDVVAARHKKPDLPVVPVALHAHPMIRMVGHPDAAINQPWIEDWARRVADWIRQGRRPYFMVHVPNNLHSPPLARTFHELLRADLERSGDPAPGPLPTFPAEHEESARGEQLSLF